MITNEVKLDYSDVLMVPSESSLTSRSDVEMRIQLLDHDDVCPIIAANMDGVGTFEMATALAQYNMLTALTKHYTVEDLVDFYTSDENMEVAPYTIYSMGMKPADLKKWKDFLEAIEIARCAGLESHGPKYVCIDVANGYTHEFEKFITHFSENYPEIVLIAGNVVTPERTDKLIECGVDIVKVGIGPGSVCTTRLLTGVGYPQFSAVLECSAAARDAGGKIIADGGITCPGDAAKAFGGGADMVMLGGYLAGHDEGGGERVPGTNRVKFYGMASKVAQHLHNGGVADYRASEGKEVSVVYKGPVEHTVRELLGGIRSACTYIGAESIDQMHRKAKFVRVNRQLNNIYS